MRRSNKWCFSQRKAEQLPGESSVLLPRARNSATPAHATRRCSQLPKSYIDPFIKVPKKYLTPSTKLSALRSSYTQLLEENVYLKKLRTNESVSTVQVSDSEVQRLSAAEEIEDLQGVLSNLHKSIRLLLPEISFIHLELEEYTLKYNHLKYAYSLAESTRQTKIHLVPAI